MPGTRPALRAALVAAVALVCFLVPTQHGQPIDCGRSTNNYPSVVARNFRPAAFVDVSCGSAQTKDMTEPQTELPAGGTNPPQFNGLRRDATLVTVGIGGNDAGLVGVAEQCAKLGAVAPTGRACRNFYAPGGKDKVGSEDRGDQAEDRRGPPGHPPSQSHRPGGDRRLPGRAAQERQLLPDGAAELRRHPLHRRADPRINAMIAGQAARNDAEFVDTYADSGGHDVCKLPPTRWFEGLVPTEPAFPLHPNIKGEASMARSAIKVLDRPRPTPRLSRLSVSPRRVRAGRRAKVSYRLDRAAAVVMRVRRIGSGRRVGNRCVRRTRRLAARRPCRRLSRVVLTVRTTGRAGPNSFRRTTRRLGRRRGLYRITATPTSHGSTGRARSSSYRVLRRRR